MKIIGMKVRPKKHLGQQFLTDLNVINKIINLIKIDTRFIVEVGSGMGALTEGLYKKTKNFIAVEIDNESITYLKKKNT